MFETQESGYVEVPDPLTDPGEHLWRFTYMRVPLHWLHVSAKRKIADEDGCFETIIFFVTKFDELANILNDEDWEIKEIYLISPSLMNRTDNWKMDVLDRIYRGQESDCEHIQNGYVFELANGLRYVESIRRDDSDLVNLELIYNASDN